MTMESEQYLSPEEKEKLRAAWVQAYTGIPPGRMVLDKPRHREVAADVFEVVYTGRLLPPAAKPLGC